MVTYLTLAYEGNYVGRTLKGTWDLFTYHGELYATDSQNDIVVLL